MDRRRWTMMIGGALLLSSTGCVRSVWFTQPLRESYEIGVVSSPMGGDALAPASLEEESDEAAADSPDEMAKNNVQESSSDSDEPSSEANDDKVKTDEIAPNQMPARSPDQLQYFVSERLVLQREVTSRDAAVMQGHIKVRRGRFIEQVVIPRKTPGVAVDWGEDWVAVSFEADSEIVFAVDGRDGTPMGSEVYHLRTQRDPEGGSTVAMLRDTPYEVRRGHNARLMVRRDSKTDRSRRRRVMRGRTLE